MNTTLYETKDRARGIRAGQRHIGGEQYRREMRAALHDLQTETGTVSQRPQHRAGCRHSRSGTVDRMSNERKIVPEAQGFYTIFTSCSLV